MFLKLAELLFRGDSSQELAFVVILALGRVMHLHPPTELLNEVLSQMVINVLNQPQQQTAMMCLSVLRCLYDTTRFTRIHTAFLVQNLKLISVLQNILDKNLDEKVSITAVQILKEIAASGFHLPMIEHAFLSSLMRVVQQPDSPIYHPTLDLLRQLVETSSYNST